MIVPTNFHLIIIKINPIIKAKVLLICRAKNIKVSEKPANTQIPQKNKIFANIKNARSKNIRMPKPYKSAEIETTINPRPIFYVLKIIFVIIIFWNYFCCHLYLKHS